MLLKFLRKKKNMKRIMWGLAILIIPAFVIWGAGSASNKKEKGPNYAGRIFNRKVSFSEYSDMWMVARDYLTRSFGQNVPSGAIDQMAWNRLILLDAVKKEHIAVNDREVIEYIASFPIFQRDGAFDKKLYKSMLGDAARGFEERVRDDIRIAKLREKVIQNISVTDEELKEGYKKKSEKIKASYVSIPFSDFEKYVAYNEKDLVVHYEDNKESFRKPEHINVEYIDVLFESFKDEVYVSEEEIKKDFEENLSDFKKPGSEETPLLDDEIKKEVSEKLSQKKRISLAEELAYKILDKALSKNELDETARSFTLKAKETGLFNAQQEIPGVGWSYEFTKRGFELKEGEISAVLIRTGKGFYIIRLKEKKPSYLPQFAEIKDSVINSYKKEKSIELSHKKAKKVNLTMKRKTAAGMRFSEIAKELDLEPRETDLITRDDYIQGVGPAGELVEAGIQLKSDEISEPIKTPNSWIMIKKDQYQGIDEERFAEEKEEFKENLLLTKRQAAFDNWFEAFKRKADFVSYTSE